MIERNKPFNDFDIFCDFCSNSENYDTNGDFYQMIKESKQDGWRMFKENGEWIHKCPVCCEKY